MLRVLENCDTTSVILALLEIVKQNQNNSDSGLLCNLVMKCLFKVTRNINEIVNKIQLDRILLQMHLLTYNFEKLTNGKETNSQSSIMIIRFIKNFIIDMVKIKREEIMDDYNKYIAESQYKDKYIYNWIMNTLQSLDYTENESNIDNNDLYRSGNIKPSNNSTNKNKLNNSDKKKENGGFIFEQNKLTGSNSSNNNSNNLNKRSVIIVKKHANNNINNRYNMNNFNSQGEIKNVTATKRSILGSNNIYNNRINQQNNPNPKNVQVYNKGKIKNKNKFKFNK